LHVNPDRRPQAPPATNQATRQPASLNLNFQIDVPEDNSIAARQFSYMLCPSLPGKLMKISKDVDDLRFVADCDPELGFTPLDIECRHCGGRIDPHSSGASLTSSCGHAARAFWSEAQMHVFIAEAWDALRQSCAHARSTAVKIC
jgi:hypothetical protein